MAAQSTAIGGSANGDSSYPSSSAAWYSVAVLMLMYIFSFIDRTTISLLVDYTLPLLGEIRAWQMSPELRASCCRY